MHKENAKIKKGEKGVEIREEGGKDRNKGTNHRPF
jgi:hypothetical protein